MVRIRKLQSQGRLKHNDVARKQTKAKKASSLSLGKNALEFVNPPANKATLPTDVAARK
jgi:hypothetical protein